ncbi:MAG: hypothetical protein E7537_06445 [Ruminococcaceae bacterium]|nr:hypothetical protein [Oscillospiraceae bacterium]
MDNKFKSKKFIIVISIISAIIIVISTIAAINLMNHNKIQNQNNGITDTTNQGFQSTVLETSNKDFTPFENATIFKSRPESNVQYKPITNEFLEPIYENKVFTDPKTKKELLYCLYLPENYTKDKKYPVILFMHGVGGVGSNYVGAVYSFNTVFQNSADIVKNAIILAPQAPDSQGYWPIDQDGWGSVAMRLLLEIEKTYSCDTNRIYITGNSMGGHGTWNLLETYGEHFAAGIPICGWGNPLNAPKLKNIPIWIYHGDQDPTVPVTASKLMHKAIKTAGGKKVQYTELEGVAHDSWPTAYSNRELISWLFYQNKTTNPNATYELIPLLTVRDDNQNIIICEKDTTLISYTTIDSQDCIELKLTKEGTKKLETAYKNSNGKTFNVYFGNKKIMTFTAKEKGEINDTFYIVGSFSSLNYYEYIDKINTYME